MQITKNTIESTPGRRELFTGAVYIDAVATPSGPSRLSASRVHFTPGRGPRGTPIRTGRRSMSLRASASCSGAVRRSR